MKKRHLITGIVLLAAIGLVACSGGSRDSDADVETRCLESGGRVTTSLCCTSSGDFPNLCAIGACGCAPDDSHEVKVCDCGPDKCFDGNECVLLDVGQ